MYIQIKTTNKITITLKNNLVYLFAFFFFHFVVQNAFDHIRNMCVCAEIAAKCTQTHTSHTYFKWQTNWYKCTGKRKTRTSKKKLAWKMKQAKKKTTTQRT